MVYYMGYYNNIKVTDMKQTLELLKNKSIDQIKSTTSLNELDQLKSRLLGKKSDLSQLLKDLPTLPVEDRPIMGKLANDIKQVISSAIKQQHTELHHAARKQALAHKSEDISLPTFGAPKGHHHPITLVTKQICSILTRCGFSIKQGPNIESDFYNFEALNIPEDHPARDMHDTFYLKDFNVLRTHTSPVQIRTMLGQKPPIKIIAPGKVYRCDADTSHSPVFHQVELFGHDKQIRLRSSYCPFTEPSVEVDVEYTTNGKTRWLEIMGAGMVHHNVFKHVDIDTENYSGYAFGCGVERIAMILYQIDNIRLFYENDQRFLKQF